MISGVGFFGGLSDGIAHLMKKIDSLNQLVMMLVNNRVGVTGIGYRRRLWKEIG
jgi:hypothetical protein